MTLPETRTVAAIVRGPARFAQAAGIAALVTACSAPPAPRDERPAPAPARGGAPAALVRDPTPARPPPCPADADPYAPEALRRHLGVFAGVELEGRAAGTDGDAAGRTLIAERLRCSGLAPAEQRFTAGPSTTANIVAVLPGRDPAVAHEIILVGAHHDHLGEDGRDRYLGANDNGSGVIAMLAVADAIQRRAERPRRTIAFVAFGAEEHGLVGSTHFVAHPPRDVPIDRVVQVVNLDMVGSYASKRAVFALGTFRGLPARALLDELDDAYPGLRVRVGGAGSGSDHEPFCRQGIPYTFFWTPDADCYHATCDTADRIDYRHMAAITGLAGSLVERLADSPEDLARTRRRFGCGRR